MSPDRTATASLRRRFLRWSLIGAVVAAVLAYGTVIGWLMANEVALVFVPNRKVHPLATETAARIERVSRTLTNGTAGLLWVMRQADRPDAPWVLYLHGNGANLSTPENIERYQQLHRLGVQVVAPEYPGYGEVDGSPSEQALGAAARDGWTWLRHGGVPASSIAIYGWSLGSGVATGLAIDVDERAVILEGAFSSIDDRAGELYPWLPVHLMVRNRFASHERIGRIGSPLLLLHATDDTIVPLAHGQRLLGLAREPRRLVELTGGHVHPNRQDEARYMMALRTFLSDVFPAGAVLPLAPAAQ